MPKQQSSRASDDKRRCCNDPVIEKSIDLTYSLSKWDVKEIKDLLKTYRVHPSDNQKIVEAFFASLDTPVSLACYLMFKYGEFEQLVCHDINPHHYNDADSFRRDFAAISFLRKHAGLKTGLDKRKRALESFNKAEERCAQTNHRIRTYLSTGLIPTRCESLLSRTIRKIEVILGSFDIDACLDGCRWGPGVTHLVKGRNTSASHKFDIERGITRDAYSLFGPILSKAFPLWFGSLQVEFAIGNNIVTVPKNAKTDRTIAIEPGINTMLQLGVGSTIRKRLRLAGFDLNSDAKNQRGAYIGSYDDSLATVDFSTASDTISRELVRLLLPPRWYSVLNSLRSHYYKLPGRFYQPAEKFSTMGNGFTFELESLIFVSAALATCEELGLDTDNVSVFGDDIVMPSGAVEEYRQFVQWLGFEINTEKTFSQGYFRESCGKYFFDGVDVKPIFLKKDPKSAKDLFRLANAVRDLSHRYNANCGCDLRFRSVWSLLVRVIPKPLRLRGPRSSGDACLHSNIEEAQARRDPGGWCGYNYTGLPEIPVCTFMDTPGRLLAGVFRSTDISVGNEIPLRGTTRTVLKRNMFVDLWYDFGPWI